MSSGAAADRRRKPPNTGASKRSGCIQSSAQVAQEGKHVLLATVLKLGDLQRFFDTVLKNCPRLLGCLTLL